MSFKAIDWAWSIRGLKVSEKLVLTYLAKSQNSKTKQCNPSVRKMVSILDINRATIFRALASLKRNGLISVVRRFSVSGDQRASQYILNLHTSQIATGGSHSETKKSQIATPLESSLESEYESFKTAPTIVVADTPSDFEEWTKTIHDQIVEKGLNPIQEYYVPSAQELLDSQTTLTVEQAIDKAKGGKKSYSKTRLARLWIDLNCVCNPHVFQKAPNPQAMGQIDHLTKVEGTDVGRVMAAVIQNWMGFGKFLKEQGIVFDYPDLPHVGFFLKHVAMAVEFSKKSTGAAPQFTMKKFVPTS